MNHSVMNSAADAYLARTSPPSIPPQYLREREREREREGGRDREREREREGGRCCYRNRFIIEFGGNTCVSVHDTNMIYDILRSFNKGTRRCRDEVLHAPA